VSTPQYDTLVARVRKAQEAYDQLDRSRAAAARALEKGNGKAAQRALKNIEQAGKAFPTHALFPAVEGSLLMALGDRPRARKRLHRAIQLQPDLYMARMSMARLEARDDRPGGTVEQASAAIRIDPSSGPAHLLLGMGLEGRGDQPRAVAAYERAANLSRANAGMRKKAMSRLAVLDPARYGPKEEEPEKTGGKGKRKKNRR
jgi:tetratricopeptide (TPR) repeat protein